MKSNYEMLEDVLIGVNSPKRTKKVYKSFLAICKVLGLSEEETKRLSERHELIVYETTEK